MPEDRLGLFGIRHHGPGSARSLLAALDALDPAIVLIEGPADVGHILHYAAAPDMRPPLAILVHDEQNPARASFYPFALYSPEWQALNWALARGRIVRFFDLPAENRLALEPDEQADAEEIDDETDAAGQAPDIDAASIRRDPLSYIAEVAGYADGEAWWNALIEQGSNGPAIFAAIETAMTALRSRDDLAGGRTRREQDLEIRREAHMRLAVAAALKETQGKIAVVCGAWHVPALREKRSQADDKALLRGLARVKIQATWVPWTETRLAAVSGYGAGVVSPGWYAHLWQATEAGSQAFSARDFIAGWQVNVAALLRRHGRPAPTAQTIEAVRLAEALAGIRDLALPGLEEMRAASLATLCGGEPAPMALIETELVVGRAVGQIADDVPQMPLASDLARAQKRLKLKPEALDQEVSLDLRSDAGLAKSLLLHRLALLRVPWGRLQGTGSSRGTFRENWLLRWEPEYSVALAEALIFGTTIEQAAGNAALAKARTTASLAEISDVVRGCLLAGLDQAAREAIALLQARAVTSSDIMGLAGAIPPLVTILRYGTARDIPAEELRLLVVSLSEAVFAGLTHACRSLQPPEAEAQRQALWALDQSLTLLGDADLARAWQRALSDVAADEQSHELLAGFAVRALYERGVLDSAGAAGYFGRALSPAIPTPAAGFWLEGFLGRDGQVLLHDAELRAVIDRWLTPLGDEDFMAILPMLRRAFAVLDHSERRRLFDSLLAARTATAPVIDTDGEHAPGFAAALPLLMTILGGPAP